MAQKYSTLFKWIHVSFDLSLLNLSLYGGYLLESPGHAWGAPADQYKLFFLLLNLIWFFCANMAGLYRSILKRDAMPSLRAALLSLLLFLVLTLALREVLPAFTLSLNFLLNISIFFIAGIVSWKTAFLFLRRSRRRFWSDSGKAVIVGAGPVGQDLYAYLQSHPQLGYSVDGFFDNHSRGNVPVLGKVKDCIDYVKAHGTAEIFCALPPSEGAAINALMHAADQHMVRFRLLPDVKGVFNSNVRVEFYNNLPVLSARHEPLEDKVNELFKRIFDVCFASLVTVFFLSWFLPLVALLIKLDSRGPVFFRQLRSGKDNKPFYCLKFRTMYVNGDSDRVPTTRGDKRITRVGAFLRKTSIDELPQFLNVLLGEMSVVGPRPHMVKQTDAYSVIIDNYMVRHFLTPGITGWAQVNGYRGETKETADMSNRVNADIWYMENWSFLLDLKIVFLTVWQSVRGHENAF
ncbi:MAG: undecaprenyl-phosphate glucose phosphotransferase [Cytophagales bacterium]|nr:undecaprenyl-phosphate glucose phosphotransferase [Cytophagales bacterium]